MRATTYTTILGMVAAAGLGLSGSGCGTYSSLRSDAEPCWSSAEPGFFNSCGSSCRYSWLRPRPVSSAEMVVAAAEGLTSLALVHGRSQDAVEDTPRRARSSCEAYLERPVVHLDAFRRSFEPGGACWRRGPEQAQACIAICSELLGLRRAAALAREGAAVASLDTPGLPAAPPRAERVAAGP